VAKRRTAATAVFPHGNVLPAGVKYRLVNIVPKSFWNRQLQMAEWREKDARELARRLAPYVGQYVALVGGGSLVGNMWTARLMKVTVRKPTYYRKTPPYRSYRPKGDVWIVVAHLRAGKLTAANSTDGRLPNRKSTFSPRLGSWKLMAFRR